MAITYTTKDTTRFVLTTDCYLPKFGGYLKRGEVISVPEGTPVSKTWTEVDENGEVIGQVGKKLPRATAGKPAHLKNKTLAEIAELEPEEDARLAEKFAAEHADEEPEAEEAAPTPPPAVAKAKAAKPAVAKAKRS